MIDAIAAQIGAGGRQHVEIDARIANHAQVERAAAEIDGEHGPGRPQPLLPQEADGGGYGLRVEFDIAESGVFACFRESFQRELVSGRVAAFEIHRPADVHVIERRVQFPFEAFAHAKQHRSQQRHQAIWPIEHVQSIDAGIAEQALQSEEQPPRQAMVDQRAINDVSRGLELRHLGIAAAIVDGSRRLPENLRHQVHQPRRILLHIAVDGRGAGGTHIVPAQMDRSRKNGAIRLHAHETQTRPVEPRHRGIRGPEIDANSNHCFALSLGFMPPTDAQKMATRRPGGASRAGITSSASAQLVGTA